MGTISDKLMRIINTKEDIRQALISKGYDVPTSIPFKEYAKMILDLPCKVDSFPDIEGIVARYSASGLTNEQMAANPVWVDKTGNGHDLQMKNFAWGGMSGVGGYNQNFNQWGYGNLSTATQTHTSYKIELSVPSTLKTANIYSNANSIGKEGDVYDFTLNIVGLKDGALLRITKGVASGVIERIEKDGIYKIYQPIEAGWDQPRIYIFISNPNLVDLNITIEQLPLYPGALVFDGVDDWAGCDNLPLLPKEKGYSIIALRNWITRYDATRYKRPLISNLDTNDEGAFLIEYRKDENVNDVTGSYNSFTDVYIDDNNPITWQTSSSYNGQIIKKGTSKSTNKLCICKTYFGQLSNYANAAIWEIVILDHDATEEELTKIKDYFVKTYPWLFPDQAWTVTGKTNEDEDRATIANITGNGNDLVLSNFGFAEGSGYNEEGEYAGYLVTDGVDDMITSSAFNIGKDFTIVGDWKFIDNKKSGTGLVKGSSFYIYNTMIGLDLYINSGSVKNSLDGIKSINAACSDGRAYDRNWNEILANTGNVVGSGGILEVSSSGGRFDRIAFKNLAIYPRILSKDDCIKAYNYLQTLKSK
jgi:hypothetical protein